jgi:flagellar L-ring protein precursor FlgH
MRLERYLHSTVLALALISSGCNSLLKEINVEPQLSTPNLQNAMAMPEKNPNSFPDSAQDPHSTWSTSSRDLFHNKRALTEGDILTVQIAMNDKAQLTNRSNRNRTGNKSLGLTGAFDVEGVGSSGNLSASLNNATDFSGNGGTARSESINLSVAAAITAVLPNGNLVITGSQEVRVNAEVRILTITGVVRPTDIQPNNTISYERIAEARISYGGRGRITEVQQPAYGQQILDRLSPL